MKGEKSCSKIPPTTTKNCVQLLHHEPLHTNKKTDTGTPRRGRKHWRGTWPLWIYILLYPPRYPHIRNYWLIIKFHSKPQLIHHINISGYMGQRLIRIDHPPTITATRWINIFINILCLWKPLSGSWNPPINPYHIINIPFHWKEVHLYPWLWLNRVLLGIIIYTPKKYVSCWCNLYNAQGHPHQVPHHPRTSQQVEVYSHSTWDHEWFQPLGLAHW